MKVLQALTRKMELEDGLTDALPDLMTQHVLARHPGSALTGADMYGWASASYLTALKRTVSALIADGYVAGSLPQGQGPQVVVGRADFVEAAAGVRPSVDAATLRDYEGMRARYSNTQSGALSGSAGGEPATKPAAKLVPVQDLTRPTVVTSRDVLRCVVRGVTTRFVCHSRAPQRSRQRPKPTTGQHAGAAWRLASASPASVVAVAPDDVRSVKG